MPGENITLEARFERAAVTLRLVVDNQTIQQSTLNVNDGFSLPTPQKLGYTFDGWFEGSTRVRAGSMPARNLTLEARFLVNSYLVTYIDAEVTSQRIEFNTLVPLPEKEKLGYRFIGWSQNGSIVESVTMPAGPVELTALYEPFSAFMAFSTPTQTLQLTLTTDQSVQGLNPLSVPSGYTFLGYYTQPFGGGDGVSSGYEIENAHAVSFYPFYVSSSQTFAPSGARLSTQPYYQGAVSTLPVQDVTFPWIEVISFLFFSVSLLGLYGWSKGGLKYETRR
jgi:uncharacterized repeat protein (TIGR02543 family)